MSARAPRASHAGVGRTRDIGGDVAFEPRRYPEIVDRWALIVGISDYRHAPWNLRFADDDARALAELLATPAAGGYEEDKVEVLVNGEATTAALTQRLRSFLKRPDRDDIVTLYFACHGAPDPDRPGNLYLLTHDTDPHDIAGTALPMHEIEVALKRTLRAERVVVLADTCHSGALTLAPETRPDGDERRTTRRGAASAAGVMKSHLQDLGKAKPGIAFLTSADHDQVSVEGEEWGGGHGVFTWFLLEGLRGEADGYDGSPKDGRVRIGELFDYVSDRVKHAVGTQHPTTGRYRFDRDMLMATTATITADKHFDQAHRLEHLARRVRTPARFRDAARRYAEARELAQGVGAEALEEEIRYGRCLVQAGDLDDAIRSLKRLLGRDPISPPPKALFYLAVAHARRFDYERAARSMKRLVATGGDHENNGWVGDYLRWLERRGTGRRHALLIGIDDYDTVASALHGCVNDTRLLDEVLSREQGFDETHVLLDAEASRAGVLGALATLAGTLDEEDQVWVCYSGHSVPEHGGAAGETPDRSRADDAYLLVHDTRLGEGGIENAISAAELHRAMRDLPARRKTLVLDTHPNRALIEQVGASGDYALLLGSDSSELAFETTVELGGTSLTAGLFTVALCGVLGDTDGRTLSYDELNRRVTERMQLRDRRQTPLLVGDRDCPVFGIEDVYLTALDLAKRRDHATLTRGVLDARCARIDAHLEAPWPEYHAGVGRARLHFGDLDGAARALERALAQRGGDYEECSVLLARTRLRLGQEAAAAAALRGQRFEAGARRELAEGVLDDLRRLGEGRRRALLVGVDPPGERDAERDSAIAGVERMRAALCETWGFAPADIVTLLGEQATREVVLAAFRALAARAPDAAVLFHFAGEGATFADGSRSLLCADDHRGGPRELLIRELAGTAAEADMISVLDVGWTPHGASPFSDAVAHAPPAAAWRVLSASASSASVIGSANGSAGTPVPGPALGTAPSESATEWRLVPQSRNLLQSSGAITVYNERLLPPQAPDGSSDDVPTTRSLEQPLAAPARRTAWGELSRALADTSRGAAEAGWSVGQWVDAARRGHDLSVAILYERDDRPPFVNALLRERCRARLRDIELHPLIELIDMLGRHVGERAHHDDRCAWCFVSMGVAEAECGRLDIAADHLAEAVSRYRAEGSEPERLGEAHYLLGRTLHRAGEDLPRAVAALQNALRRLPDSPEVLLQLGLAMIDMTRRENIDKARAYLARYLELGAPLGRRDEVRRYTRDAPSEETLTIPDVDVPSVSRLRRSVASSIGRSASASGR